MIVATAPGRCGIVGNPTDMYGGSVLSISTRERARCALSEGGAPGIRVRSSGVDGVLHSTHDLDFQGDRLDVARAALRWFGVDPAHSALSIELTTDIPMQAGMAGSTALVVTLVGALARHCGRAWHPWTTAENARKIEDRVMGVVCGLQDQHMAVFGGINYMDFAGKAMLEQRDDEPLATIEPLAAYAPELPLIAAHTGIQHHSGIVHSSPRERWLAGETLVVESYRRIAGLARLGKRALLAGDWQALGALMNENHALVAALGGSGPENDHLIAAALTAGAYGAKLAGAGGGGTILALAYDIDRVAAALSAAGAESLLRPVPSPGLVVEEC